MRKTISLSLLVVVVLLAALAGSPVFGAGEQGLDKAEEARQRHTNELMAIDGVVGVALGLNRVGKGAVVVLTKEAGVKGIPETLDEGVPVRVRVTGEIFALKHECGHKGPPCQDDNSDCVPTGRCDRPVSIGISTGHPAITACTIGARLTDGSDVYALSNNHCYAASNSASIGDKVLQPGTFDGGSTPADAIGTLDDFEPIVFSTLANNVIDAAVALSSTANLGNATLSDGYGTPKSTTIKTVINQKVKKYGRTTGQTKGQVFAINATVMINYGSPGLARFVNQIIITPGSFSAGGDSGSLIVADAKGRNKADDRKPVGLLYAGSSSVTIANPIDAVLARFGVTVDGEAP